MDVLVSDRADREAARGRLDRNVVVVAGAGTGKTTLLTDRMLGNLLGRERPVPITAVVALTFTEKAAGEIRLRLAERLLELVTLLTRGPLAPAARQRAEAFLAELRGRFGRPEAEVLARARAALQDMDQAQIGTIHSFAAHLLRLYPMQAGVDPGLRVDEGPEFEELFAAQWARWLDSELGEDASGPRREDWLAVLRWAPLEDLEDLARGLAAQSVDLAAAGRPDPDAARRLQDLAQTLRRAPQGQPVPKGNSRIREALAGLAESLERLAAAAASPKSELGRLRRAPLPQAKWPAGWDAAGLPAYERAQRIAACASAEGDALLRRAARLLAPFADSFRGAYTRAGLVSFDGLLLKARDLVRDHPEVREELKAKYETLLVDEFQDTDPLQGELLLFLAEERGGRARRWDQVRPGPGRLFIVGDPKQSIYRFRGADIAAYQGFTGHLLRDAGGALACDLRTNFRSTAGLIAAVNAVFPRLMRHVPGSQPDYAPIEPSGEAGACVPFLSPQGRDSPAQRDGTSDTAGAGSPAVELVVVGPAAPGGPEPDALTGQKTESAWIAQRIVAERAPGRLRYKDAAVLMRTSSALAPLLDAFKAAGIPYVVEMEKLFYGSQEIIDFLNLLRVLDDPEDRFSWTGLLRSPLLGLADQDLCGPAGAGAFTYIKDPPAALPAGERRRLKKLCVLLRGLRGRVGRVPLGEFVHAVLGETPFLAAAARAYHGQQSVSNLLKFSRLAAEAGDERGLTLKEFIGLVARAMDEARAEGESPLADEHLDAVRILSIHKAKGLEFPVVFVCNLSGASGRGGGEAAVLKDWQSGRIGLRLPRCGAADAARALLEAQERERQQDEAVRLLYVALTRAKERLFLVGREKADKGTFAHLLREAGAWPASGQAEVDLGAGGRIPVHSVTAGWGVPRSAAEGRGGIRPEHRLPREDSLARSWTERLRRREAAAAARWTRTATQYLGEGGPAPRWDESPAPAAGGALLGQVCHRVLAGWDFRGQADPSAAVAQACLALRPQEPGADWEAVRRESEEVLRGFLRSQEARELSEAEILGREVPFVFSEKGTVVRGAVDLVLRKGGRVVVADYKSEKVPPGGAARLREKYRRQGEDYCAAVERAWGLKDAEFRLIFLRKK